MTKDNKDRRFMRLALSLAGEAMGSASPNPTVGAVIVKGGKVIAQGWHEYDQIDHAEVRALSIAGSRARGATVYLTLEPCAHHGRTPPCVNALLEAGIRRAVIATMDPNPRVFGQGVERLRSAGVQVDLGLMQEEAGQLIEAFACHVTTGRPLVTAKVGMSLDGRIATARKTGQWITSPAAGEFSQSLRFQSDALLVGSGTILADDPELTYRGALARRRPLMRVILDSRLRTPPGARVFATKPVAPVLLFCSPDAPKERRLRLERQGAEILSVPHGENGLDVGSILRVLGKREVLGLLVEGGAEIHWSFLSAGLVDKFYFIVAPLILGGRSSVPSVGGQGYSAVSEAPRFRLRRQFAAGSDLVLEAYPSYSKSILSPWQ